RGSCASRAATWPPANRHCRYCPIQIARKDLPAYAQLQTYLEATAGLAFGKTGRRVNTILYCRRGCTPHSRNAQRCDFDTLASGISIAPRYTGVRLRGSCSLEVLAPLQCHVATRFRP